jgi:hypothetical protein
MDVGLQRRIVAGLACPSINIVAGQRDKAAKVSSLRGRCAAQEQRRDCGATPSLASSDPVSHFFKVR